MWAVEAQLGHVNQFLEDRPAELQAEFDALAARILKLAETPFDTSTDYFIDVLDARAHGAELCLRAANSALMHQGARGYLMSSEVQRRVREAQFVAIVTPAIKHLRKEIARLSRRGDAGMTAQPTSVAAAVQALAPWQSTSATPAATSTTKPRATPTAGWPPARASPTSPTTGPARCAA